MFAKGNAYEVLLVILIHIVLPVFALHNLLNIDDIVCVMRPEE